MSAIRGGPKRWLLVAAALALVTTVFAAPSHAQILYGSIIGQVTDPQKAALPGVTVTAINSGTGLKLETVTDEVGNYTFRNLLPGSYDVSATLTGFKELKQTGIPVSAGNPKRIDITLPLGGMTETVEVVAETTLMKTEKADISSEISAKAVTNLPLNQFRNYQTLLNLVPGATPTQFQNAEIDTPGRSLRTWVNGVQPNANTTRVDGAASVNVWLPHHAMYIQSAESIDTVNVSTNNFDADTGMAAGAAQTVITKSGTNVLKGSAFYFWNKDAYNANSFSNNAFGIAKNKVDTKIYGGSLGGPVIKNKLFYFASFERYDSTRPTIYSRTVPTAKMRAGDFSEVAAAYPTFKLFNPFTGDKNTGVGREQWTNNVIPSQYLNPIVQNLMKDFLPMPNTTADVNGNLLLDDYNQLRNEFQKRNNFDGKVTWQRTAAHQIWGKFGMMKNKGTGNNFYLGFNDPPNSDTRVIVTTLGTTWTLNSNTVMDANFGMSRQDQTVLPADYGKNYGLQYGVPGTNDPNDIRSSGLPVFASSYTINPDSASWMPLWRKEINWSGTVALTKVFNKHEIRTGFDFVRYELNHRQAEWGNYGLKGGLSFSGNTTGAAGYNSPGWNSFGAMIMGLPNFFSKDTQTEEMTGRENQFALYVRDRWMPNPKLTFSGGVRMEIFPLMTRANGRGLEILDYNTYVVSLGGIGGVPKNVGINMKTVYFEPRIGGSYRLNADTVFRAGYGFTKNPLPWSRPMRGSYPFDVNFNNSAPGGWDYYTYFGVPTVVLPDQSSGKVVLPRGVYIRSPNPNMVDRGTIQQWNIAVERKVPGDIAIELAYVGTATDGGYADLNQNVGVPGGGGTAAKYYAVAGTTSINDWGSRTKARYKGLQVSANRPFRNGLMLKGSYTWSQAKNMADEDGWTGVTWNYLPKWNDNFALAGYDRTHMFSLGWVYELPFLKGRTDAMGTILGGWQVNGVWAMFSGAPFGVGGSNNAMLCTGCGSILANVQGDPKPTGRPGAYSTELYYDKTLFSQPSGLGLDGFGTSKRNQFRQPSQWNVDFSLFKAFAIGKYRPEFRADFANVFNHVNWGTPNTSITSPLFMQYRPGNWTSGNTPGPRRIQFGLRFAF